MVERNHITWINASESSKMWFDNFRAVSTYMCLLGLLVLRARYVPKLMGVFLLVAGVGYLVDNLKYFFYPGVDTGFLWFAYFGELIFMVWLLVVGAGIKKLRF